MNAVDVPRAVLKVRLQRRESHQRRVRLSVCDLYHRLCEILVALHHVEMDGITGCFRAIPLIGTIQIAGVQVDPAEHSIDVWQETLEPTLGKLLPQGEKRAAGVLALSACHLAARQQTADGKLHVRRALLPDLAHAGDQRQHPAGDVFALFKLAFRHSAVRKSDAVLTKNRLHRNTDGVVEQIILFAPWREILATVHDAWQRTGDREGRERDFFIGEQSENGRNGLRQALHASLRERNIQPSKAAAGLLPSGVIFSAAMCKFL